jgi:phosphotransferase system enzyme I (PtsI)
VMARALAIPAVVATHDATARVASGDEVLLDGNRGIVIQRPSPQRLDEYGKVVLALGSIETDLRKLRNLPAETSDGTPITLSANIEMAEDVKHVREAGANGVGLFRSEYLYLAKRRLPTEEELFESYDAVARELAPAPVIVRTLDAGGDKFLAYIGLQKEANPFLGCRAIRFCLAHPDIFRTQLRAILRASRHGNVKIMYPMVSVADELACANDLLEAAKQDLLAEGIPFNRDIEVGAMVETPSAAIAVDLLAPMVKFFSVGTNDLIQYTFAVDRVNEQVAHLYEPTHPAVLRLIRNTVEVSRSRGVWTGVCGEMAANPVLAPLLVGLGVAELSVAPAALPAVKAAIRSVSMDEARELVQAAMAATSGAAVLALCRKLTQRKAPEILALVD